MMPQKVRTSGKTGQKWGTRRGADCSHQKLGCRTIWDMLLRPAEPTDAMAVARVHVRSWQAAYRGLMPDDYLDQLRPEDRAKKYTFGSLDPLQPQTIVATEGPAIHGFATTAPARDMPEGDLANYDMSSYGELCALYVDPEQWGRGIGVALISAARAGLVDRGFRDAMLWVLAGNVRAERFYRMDQWSADGARRTDEVWGVKVDEIRYQRALL
jgi:GNAT superfamily N-acetyltransferase